MIVLECKNLTCFIYVLFTNMHDMKFICLCSNCNPNRWEFYSQVNNFFFLKLLQNHTTSIYKVRWYWFINLKLYVAMNS